MTRKQTIEYVLANDDPAVALVGECPCRFSSGRFALNPVTLPAVPSEAGDQPGLEGTRGDHHNRDLLRRLPRCPRCLRTRRQDEVDP